MKILHIITGLKLGGAESFLVKLLKNMNSRCFENVVVSLTDNREMAHSINALGIEVQVLDFKRSIPDPRVIKTLIKIIKIERPDLVQTWMYHSDLAGGLAAKYVSRKLALVWNIRTSYSSSLSPNNKGLVWCCALASRFLPNKIIANSHAGKHSHLQIGYPLKKMVVIENGFDVEYFKPDADARSRIRAKLAIPPDAFSIGMIANYLPEKDHQTFFKATSIIHDKNPDVHFILVGRNCDIDNPLVRSIISSKIPSNRFHFLGVRSDVNQIMASLDLGTLCSLREGFPNVLGETMSCGVPFVATDVGDCADLIGDTGLIVPPHNPAALADAWYKITQMTGEERNLIGHAARQRIESRFGLQQVVGRYQELYASLAPEKNSLQ
ncbi:MAG: glycosyltransferase [Pseudomonadota bacterium]